MIMKPRPMLGLALPLRPFAPKSETSFSPSPVCPSGFRNWLMTRRESFIVIRDRIPLVNGKPFARSRRYAQLKRGQPLSGSVTSVGQSVSVIGGANDPSGNPSESSAKSQALERRDPYFVISQGSGGIGAVQVMSRPPSSRYHLDLQSHSGPAGSNSRLLKVRSKNANSWVVR